VAVAGFFLFSVEPQVRDPDPLRGVLPAQPGVLHSQPLGLGAPAAGVILGRRAALPRCRHYKPTAAERALPQLLAGPSTTKQKNAALPGAHRRIESATRTLEQVAQDGPVLVGVGQATAALRAVPAKVAATAVDPDATPEPQR